MANIDLVKSTNPAWVKVSDSASSGGSVFHPVKLLDRASRAEFDARRAELAKAGIAAGAFVREYGESSEQLSEQVFHNIVLVANAGKIFWFGDAIWQKWASFGGQHWAVPTMDEADTLVGGGRWVDFRLVKRELDSGHSACICWSNSTGANEVSGIACEKFYSLGGVQGIGYPVTGNCHTANNDGRFTHFRRAYVNDEPSTIFVPRDWKQAWHVHGAIWQLYNQMGMERSPLGFPKSDEFGPYDGAYPERRQYFEGGTVIWTPTLGAFIETPAYSIIYRGLNVVHMGADNTGDANSEYYFIAGAIPRVNPSASSIVRMPEHALEYGDLRTGRWRHDNVLVYAGNADSVLLTISGAERDTGDPNKYLALIQEGSKKAIGAALTALGALLGGVGAAVGSVAGSPLSAVLGDGLGTLINSVLDTGDDPLNSVAVPLGFQTIRQYLDQPPAQAPARRGDGSPAAPMPYHFKVRMRGGGHELDLFFEIVRG